MIGIVSRLTDQKGFDLIAYMMDELCQQDVQLVVLGTGEERYENMFRHFALEISGQSICKHLTILKQCLIRFMHPVMHS